MNADALLAALERGERRAATRADDGTWTVDASVKADILALFRSSDVVAADGFVDKRAFPRRTFGLDDGVRLVPGGSAVRRGAFVGNGCVLMPPCYVNVGAYVGAGTLVDSHALVGSCVQVGERVHVSAGAQLGGVLEPVGARPVIVEDDVFVGGQVGLYEGALVRTGAVLAAGLMLTASTPIYDVVHERVLDGPPEIPAGAVVVPGARPPTSAWAREHGLTLAAALIVKYRDASTDAATALENALR